MRAEKGLRLRTGCRMVQVMGPYLIVSLNGVEVDPAGVYALDEREGWIDMLLPRAPAPDGRRRWQIDIDPVTEAITPRLNRITGHVRVRLADGAPVGVSRIYEDFRYGDLQEKLDILRGGMSKR